MRSTHGRRCRKVRRTHRRNVTVGITTTRSAYSNESCSNENDVVFWGKCLKAIRESSLDRWYKIGSAVYPQLFASAVGYLIGFHRSVVGVYVTS